jgi:hypothetical protein
MKKLVYILISVILIIGLSFYFFLNHVGYPNFDYDHVKVLSLDRKMIEPVSTETQSSKLTPPLWSVDGYSFLNDSGFPVHKYYTERLLSATQTKEIQDCLIASGLRNESPNECTPVFRDAVVYYDKNDVPIGWISICFDCQYIEFSPKRFHVSNKSVARLHKLFQRYNLVE